MGLCKCAKKKVTNQFCFEHRVNVCEHCMLQNHPKCIVQSYLQWLQDSDYNPICELCQSELSNGDCVRLLCYHVFHLRCLNSYAAALPAHTAPDGYACPACKCGIFPPDNAASPVADHVRHVLSDVDWAKKALGIITPASSTFAAADREVRYDANNAFHHGNVSPASSSADSWLLPSESFASNDVVRDDRRAPDEPAARFVEKPENAFSSVLSGPTSNPRKMYDTTTNSEPVPNVAFDHDDNKYKRRSALEWFARWFKSYTRPKARHDPHRRFKRCVVVALLVVISLLTLVMIFQHLGRASADEDPFLDPMANPHIRVGQNRMGTD